MRITHLTRTAKSAKGKLALTLFSALAVLGATTVLGAPKPSFSLSATPATQTVTPGQTATYTVGVNRQNKHAAAVNLTVSGLPSKTTASFVPNPVPVSGSTSSFKVNTNVGGTTPAGTYTLTINGSGGGVTSSTTAKLVVVSQAQANFTLSATPAQSVIAPNDSASHTIDITRSGGFTQAVSLSASGLPNGVAAALAPNPAGGSTAILAFTSGSNPKPGTYPVTITGTGGGLTRSTSVSLTVEENKPFGISGNAPQGFAPGRSVPLNLALTNPHNFTINVTEIAVDVDHNTSKPACDGEQNYTVDPIPSSRYPLSLPANSTRTLSQLGVSDADKPSVVMNSLEYVSQDGCKGATVFFNYSGMATK